MPSGKKIDVMQYNKEELERLYEITLERDIAKMIGLSRGGVKSLLIKLGIKRRTRGEAIKLAWKGKLGKYRGENSTNWKGGRLNHHGYIRVYKPNHPSIRGTKCKYIYEHRLVWEETHGKLLPKGLVIHHLNGIKNDNRPENLVALPRKKHGGMSYDYIHELQERIRGLEKEIHQLVKPKRLLGTKAK